MKEEYADRIINIIKGNNRFCFGVGVQIGGGDNNDASHLIGKRFLDTQRQSKHLMSFKIKHSNQVWEVKNTKIHRPRNPDLFEPPMLLIKKGITNSFRLVTAVANESMVFTDSITSVKAFNNKDSNT